MSCFERYRPRHEERLERIVGHAVVILHEQYRVTLRLRFQHQP